MIKEIPKELDYIYHQVKPSPAFPWSVSMVYLAGPVDFTDDAHDWREQVADKLLEFNIASFSPPHAFKAGGMADPFVSPRLMAINFAAIWNSDLVFVNLGNTLSVGTSREIQQAINWGKPVIVVSEKRGHYLSDCLVYPTIDKALEWIFKQTVD